MSGQGQAEELKRLLASSNETDRRQGIALLAKVPSKESLIQLLKIGDTDPSGDVRFLARKAVAFLKDGLKPRVVEKPPEIKDMSGVNWGKAGVEEKLGIIQFAINKNLKTNLRFFLEVLKKETDVQVLSALVVTIGKFGGEKEIEPLISFLAHESPRVRANTIEAIELLGISKARVAILLRLEDSDNRVRANAVKVARDIAPDQILKVVTEMIGSPKVAMQASGAFILQFLPSEKSVGLLEPLLQSPNASVRTPAIATLKKFREKKVKSAEPMAKKHRLFEFEKLDGPVPPAKPPTPGSLFGGGGDAIGLMSLPGMPEDEARPGLGQKSVESPASGKTGESGMPGSLPRLDRLDLRPDLSRSGIREESPRSEKAGEGPVPTSEPSSPVPPTVSAPMPVPPERAVSESPFSAQLPKMKEFMSGEKWDMAVKTALQVFKEFKGKEIPEVEVRNWRRLLGETLVRSSEGEVRTALAQLPVSLFKAWQGKPERGEKASGDLQAECVICTAKLGQGHLQVMFKEKAHLFCFDCGKKLEWENKERQEKLIMALRTGLENGLLACELDPDRPVPERLLEVAAEVGMGPVCTGSLRQRLGLFHYEDVAGLLDRSDPHLRLAAGLLAGEFGSKAQDLVPRIVGILGEVSPPARNPLLAALKKIGPQNIPGALSPDLQKTLFEHELSLLTGSPLLQRKEALEWLQLLNPDWRDQDAVMAIVPALVKEMAGGPRELQFFLAGFFQKLGPGSREAVPALTKFMHSWDEELHLPVKNALGAIDPQWPVSTDGETALKAFVGSLPDEPVKIQTAMLGFLESLETVGESVSERIQGLSAVLSDETVIPVYEKALKKISPTGFSRYSSRKTRGRILSAGIHLVGLLLFAVGILAWQYMVENDKTAGFLLYKAGVTPPDELSKILSNDLAGREQHKKLTALSILGKMGSDGAEALPGLIDAFLDKDPLIRARTEVVLNQVSPEWYKSPAARKAISHFIPMIINKDPNVRAMAIDNLGKIDKAWNTTSEAKALIPELIALWNNPDPELAKMAEDMVRRIEVTWNSEEEEKKILPVLEKALQSKRPRVRKNVITIFAKMASTEDAMIPRLIDHLTDVDEEVRQAVEAGLQNVANPWISSEKIRSFLPLIAKKLNSSNPLERDLAIALYERNREHAALFLPAILDELAQAPESRASVIFKLLEKLQADWASTEPAQKMLKDLVERQKTSDADTRIRLLRMISYFKGHGRPALPGVAACLLDASFAVRMEAGNTLKEIDPNWAGSDTAKSILPGLRKQLQSGDSAVILQVIGVVQKLQKSAEPLVPDVMLLYVTTADEEVRLKSEALLKGLNPDWVQSPGAVQAVPDLVKAFAVRKPEERRLILDIFDQMGPLASDAAEELTKILPQEQSPERLEVIGLLGKMGPKGKVAIPELKKLLEHPSFELRAGVIKSLESIIPGWKVTDEIGKEKEGR